jgi:Plavaka transposase
VGRVGDGTVPLAIVIYIDGSYIKSKIAVKPIYITVRNLSSAVSGKSMAWRVLGMLPALKKKACVGESNAWRAQRRLRLHHACMKHVVDSINAFCSDDKHLLCADGKVIYH